MDMQEPEVRKVEKARTPVSSKLSTGSGIGSMIMVIAVWVAGLYGIRIPADVAVALSGLVVFGIGFMVRENSGSTER